MIFNDEQVFRLLAFTLALLVLVGYGCTRSETSVTVLEDVTEPNFQTHPHPDAVIDNYGFDENLFTSARFRYSSISSLNHNAEYELSLEGESNLLSNELERREAIKDFEASIEKVLHSQSRNTYHNYSSIWKPIVREIEKLQAYSGAKLLLVYSDLQENNKWFSIHRRKDLQRLIKQSDEVKEQFLAEAKAIKPSDSLLKVIVVYQPKNMKDDERFTRLADLYRSIFKELDIPISFKTQITSYESSSKSALENPE